MIEIGNSTTKIPINSGVRQGCPLSLLESSFRWIRKSKLNNITKVTILKLLHRKLYTEDEDGGVNVIFNTPYSKSLWEIINSIWKYWTTTGDNFISNPKNILNFAPKSKYLHKKNILTCITIRELYRSYCNEKLNKVTEDLLQSIKRIRKDLTLTLEVALSYGIKDVYGLDLGGKWIRCRTNHRKSIKTREEYFKTKFY